jgi:glucose dehydrogenase
MQTQHASLRSLLLGGSVIFAALGTGAFAADVTPDRLANADKEPGNWLMNHRTYDAQRYSPLDTINKANVKSLKLAYAVAIGGTAANENLEATPLAEDGFLYLTDQWGVLYKIDGRSGDVGRIVWRWIPARRSSRWRTAAPHCGAISSSPPPTIRRASSPPTRTPAGSPGRPISPTASPTCSSPPRRSP